MRKLYYYLIGIPILTLLFSFSVNAATTGIIANGTDQNGNTFQVTGNTYSSQEYDEQYQIENASGLLETVYKYNLSQNITIKNLKSNNYYNGRVVVTITDNPSNTATRNRVGIDSSYIAEGLYVYLDAVTTNTYRVCIIFDNYYATDTTIGLPTIWTEYKISRSSASGSQLYLNTNTSLSVTYSNGFTPTTSPMLSGFADVLSAMIGWSINSAQEFDDIINLLNLIKNQDYVYYTQLTSQMSSILTNQANIYQSVLDVIDEIDADFQDVQTVLDLFPSYRTQVLAYWQQLLEMNASQSSEAAELESQYQDKGSQSADLNQGLGSLNLPEVDSDDFNILGNVDAGAKTNFFGLIGLITNNSLVTTILIIIVTGAIVGYTLYGKK